MRHAHDLTPQDLGQDQALLEVHLCVRHFPLDRGGNRLGIVFTDAPGRVAADALDTKFLSKAEVLD